jgi:hypothetical protein
MNTVLRYRGRTISESDVSFIRDLMVKHPSASRRSLSLALCAAWAWVQPNGYPRDGVCRGMLLALHRAGQIELPAPRRGSPGQGWRGESAPLLPMLEPTLRCSLAELGPLQFRQVRRTPEEAGCNDLFRRYHYLGYTRPVGEHLKFMIFAGSRPVACFLWTSAPRHLGPRDRFIGWPATARRENIHLVAYNSRYLILPWVEVPHLASHLLGRMVRMLSAEWQGVYNHPVALAETFVDRTRWKGTCYRAANWICVGQTTGRGKNDQTNRPNRPKKDVLVYPLRRDFRALLMGSTSCVGGEA